MMNLKPLPTVPCKYCGTPTTYTGTKQCDPCHNAQNTSSETLLKILIERGDLKQLHLNRSLYRKMT